MTVDRQDKLIRRGGSVLSVELEPLHVVAERSMLAKTLSILDNTSQTLHSVLAGKRNTFNQRLINAVKGRGTTIIITIYDTFKLGLSIAPHPSLVG